VTASAIMSLSVQGVLCVLLAALLWAGVRLSRRLDALRQDKSQLMGQVAQLSEAISRAQTAVHLLRATAKEAEELLSNRIETARGLANELAIMTGSGESLARRLESGAVRRATHKPRPEPASERPAAVAEPERPNPLKILKGLR
jgi:cell division septum initiation protein DivIVA